MLNIEHVVDLPEKSTEGATGQYTDGEFVYISKNAGRLVDFLVQIEDGNYGEIQEGDWESRSSELSAGSVGNFGVNSFSRVGPYGFFIDTSKEDKLTIKTPIRARATLPQVKGISLANEEDRIAYSIDANMDNYDYIRIRFTNHIRNFSFIVSDLEGELWKPENMAGNFLVTARGYRNELQEISKRSKEIVFLVE